MSIENEILLESDNQNLVKEADAKVRNIIVDLLNTNYFVKRKMRILLEAILEISILSL